MREQWLAQAKIKSTIEQWLARPQGNVKEVLADSVATRIAYISTVSPSQPLESL